MKLTASESRTLSSRIVKLQRATSFLFVPGDRPERFSKAMDSGADIVIIDWEASVIPNRKSVARKATIDFLQSCGDTHKIALRLNPVQTDYFVDDYTSIRSLSVCGVFLTMTESTEEIHLAQNKIPNSLPFVAMIETAKGIVRANELASSGRVCRLAFGNMDYQTDLGLTDHRTGTIYPSSVIAVASRNAGLPQPIAGVTANFSDSDFFHEEAAFEKSLGYSAKLCIHPKQIPWTHHVFDPTEQDIAWANTVLEATQHSHAVQIDGVMIDRPVIERAKKILAQAAQRNPSKE
ncbi:CoA ester lyase [Pseudomonas atacamensis]|uniref:CoA ester lyase n=1 Tax=Pseudomonas atacamensis TaxID=2565368 RepID=A0AAQ2D6D0_9PSED|nr:CoA ester lyase [Pseudomonas atacamensis]THF25771.1 CoA ester lyase [Pseudomonas atacamensis]